MMLDYSAKRLAELRRVLHYDCKTGKFHWLVGCGPAKAGDTAGTPITAARRRGKHGYIIIGYTFSDGYPGRYRAHRLAWWFMTNKIPPNGRYALDHIDGDRTNNAWSNLRKVTYRQNSQNLNNLLRNDNTTGHRGVYPLWSRGKFAGYAARIVLGGKPKHLGNYDRLNDAIVVRKVAEAEYYGASVSSRSKRLAAQAANRRRYLIGAAGRVNV